MPPCIHPCCIQTPFKENGIPYHALASQCPLAASKLWEFIVGVWQSTWWWNLVEINHMITWACTKSFTSNGSRKVALPSQSSFLPPTDKWIFLEEKFNWAMQCFWRNWQDMASRSWRKGIYGATYIGVASQTSNKRNIPFNGKRNIWLGYLEARLRWVYGMALAWIGKKGHLSMEREYAQVQVQRGAQEPNQRQKREKPRKRKSCENQGVTGGRMGTWLINQGCPW